MTDKPMTLAEQNKVLRDALDSIRRYGLDTLSGRTDGPGDMEWQRQAVNEMTKRARVALALPVLEDKDGERWRRFRALHWSEDGICAVLNPKQNVRLGGMCPSGEHLDFLVDALTPIERAHGIQGKEGWDESA